MNPRRYKETAVRGAESGVILTQELIDEFITNIQAKGYVKGTVDRYQTSLEQLYDSLSGEKRIGRGTLAACRKQMLEDGYAVRTANLRISAANSLLGYLGLREYQLTDQIKPEDENLPEITRQEYLKLLQTARSLGRERVYLLVKLFASTGLPLQELSKVTVESVTEGELTAVSCGTEQEIHFPDCLRKELLTYATAILKTLAILNYLKEEFFSAHIGGATLHSSNPYYQFEMGAEWSNNKAKSCNRHDVTIKKNILENEKLKRVDYCAWVFHCMTLSVIEENGLPFPFFIKGDDIEYSLRSHSPIITMNGIDVWHEPYSVKHSSHLTYFDYRNKLVIQSIYQRGISAKK